MTPESQPSTEDGLDRLMACVRDRPIAGGPVSRVQAELIERLMRRQQGPIVGIIATVLNARMTIRLAVAAVLLLACCSLLFVADSQRGGVALGDNVRTARMQVDVLQMLYDLKATPTQIRALRRMTIGMQATQKGSTRGESMQAAERHAQVGSAYPQALAVLHDALLTDDEDKIGAAVEQVQDLENKLDIDDVDIEATPTARENASSALRLFNASQIAGYIAEYSDDVADPTQTILDALASCRGLSIGDFASLRDDTADRVALLVAGLDPARADPIAKKVSGLLERDRRMSDAAFAAGRPDLEKSARAITESVSSFDVLQHWMLGNMTSLLSNPQLGNILDERLDRLSRAGKGSD